MKSTALLAHFETYLPFEEAETSLIESKISRRKLKRREHLLVNGDMATIILMLGMITLSFGGMRHIDYRRAKLLGSAWGPVALTTSVTPFKAVFQGRCKLDLKGIGLLRVLGGVLIYAGLLIAHEWISGVQLINIEIIN